MALFWRGWKGPTALSGGLIILLIITLAGGSNAPAKAPNPRPTPVINSPQVPSDVAIPDDFPGDQNPIAFFDDFSWRSFIALVWPALKDQRGKPDTNPKTTVGSPGPRVFETYKSLWELFHPDGSAPADWTTFESKQFNPCGVETSWGDLTLGSFSKFGDLGQAGVGSLIGPLVAQPKDHPSYVRFLTGFNEVEFRFILNPTGATPAKPLYLRANLEAATPLTFPNGAGREVRVDGHDPRCSPGSLLHPHGLGARPGHR